LAGTGLFAFGGDGRQATKAAMKYVYDIAVDASGNIYIADSYNNRIRLVTTSTGIISTVAGTGSAGYSGDGGPATSATLNLPYGIAVDTSGNLYIADSANSCIRIVTKSTGIISTVAGNGLADYSGDGDQATLATLNYPYGVAVDASGNIFIADTVNNCIRMVTVGTGVISTMAGSVNPGYSGDGKQATSAALSSPRTVTADASGNIYIADADNNRIRMVTVSTGIITTVAGSGSYPGSIGDGGPATSARLSNPNGITVDVLGNIYIADSYNNRIRMVTKSTGIISAVAGTGSPGSSGDGGQATLATMNNPWAVAIDALGNIYIADTDNYRVRMFVLPAAPTAAPTPFRIITAKPTSSGASLFTRLK
jgi:trimeric autotransporter adhesin